MAPLGRFALNSAVGVFGAEDQLVEYLSKQAQSPELSLLISEKPAVVAHARALQAGGRRIQKSKPASVKQQLGH